MERKLTVKQQAFVDNYDGNATEAARKAGYKGNNDVLAHVGRKNLSLPHIWNAIQKRIKKPDKVILSREELQEFWTGIIKGKDGEKKAEIRDQLKASELLGKSQAVFTDNINHKLPSSIKTMADGIKEIGEHFKSNPELENDLLREAEG
jgi:phage terminase small subunit